jgi:hypothetical protein
MAFRGFLSSVQLRAAIIRAGDVKLRRAGSLSNLRGLIRILCGEILHDILRLGRPPGVKSGARAWAVLDGKTWTEVDSFEVLDSGRPVSPETFAAIFSSVTLPSGLDA